MKKIICLLLSIAVIVSLCGCGSENTESINFSQEVTIVKMPSPPKCKTTDDVSVVNEVIAVLGKIEKSPIEDENINGGWSIMIKLNIDGQSFNYTIGGVFTDSDGKQYYVTNGDEIEKKITEIYNKIDAPEVDYP
ncbi:MAG: hypothetical protein IJN22_02850 [Clostridia bacterium]|nr:hypothetical protein [Clostridia bacterium]